MKTNGFSFLVRFAGDVFSLTFQHTVFVSRYFIFSLYFRCLRTEYFTTGRCSVPSGVRRSRRQTFNGAFVFSKEKQLRSPSVRLGESFRSAFSRGVFIGRRRGTRTVGLVESCFFFLHTPCVDREFFFEKIFQVQNPKPSKCVTTM